jgi:hypothetical protein
MRPASLFKVVASSVIFAVVGTAGAQSQDPVGQWEARRAQLLKSHYGVAEALQVDQARVDELAGLLADQLLAERDDSPARNVATTDSYDITDSLAARAERMNGYYAKMREVIGPEKFERYWALRYTLGNRLQVRELDDRLEPAHKLSPSQREQLVELLYENTMSEVRHHLRSFLDSSQLGEPTSEPLSQEQLQLRWNFTALAANQEAIRRLSLADRQLVERAARFLTPTQLASFESTHAQQAKSMQRQVEQMRSQLGLSATIPDQPVAAEAGLARVDGEARLRLRVVVNRDKPKYFTEKVSSGQPAVFQIGDGLVLEALAILFEQDQYDVLLSYHEVGTTGQRWLGGTRSSGTLVKAPPGHQSRDLGTGGNGTIVQGDKAHAVQLSSIVEAI